jgi:competence protein ComGE
MLRKNNGYFLVEQLLSLYTLLLICTFFLPLFMDITDQAQQLQLEKQATQLLYEELNTKVRGDEVFSNHSVNVRGTSYYIYWNISGDALKKEVCVKVEDKKLHKQQWCETFE